MRRLRKIFISDKIRYGCGSGVFYDLYYRLCERLGIDPPHHEACKLHDRENRERIGRPKSDLHFFARVVRGMIEAIRQTLWTIVLGIVCIVVVGTVGLIYYIFLTPTKKTK